MKYPKDAGSACIFSLIGNIVSVYGRTAVMEFAESKGTSAPDDAAFIDIPEEMIAEMPFR